MTFVNTLKAAAAVAALLALGGCQGERQLSQNNKHYVPISAEMQASLNEKGVSARAPMLIRAYKKESELEVWKQSASGQYVLVKTFPMCRWSGQLGPKVREGDRQVPEGFYSITPGAMNPNSSFYLSFNVGYPNAYDKAHGRTGALIMVHGACSSMGCFSMTDQQIADIYALARESFAGGQQAIQMQSYPFRFSPDNLAKYRADPNMPFWKMLKEGSDSFDVTKRETRVSVCDRKYVFNKSGSACAPDASSPVVQAVAAKAQADEVKVASLTASTPAVRRMYSDGDQHPTFRGRYSGDNVSQPQTLGSVSEVAVADVPRSAPATAKASARPAAVAVAASPRPTGAPAATSAPQSAQAFSPAPEAKKDTPSFFRKWLGNEEPAEAATETAKVAPAAPATPAKAKPEAAKTDPAKAKQTRTKPKAAEKTADASEVVLPPETSVLKGFVARITGAQ